MTHPVEEWFRLIADTISEVFWISDRERRCLHYMSPAFERVWGRPADYFRGDPRNVLGTIHPDDRARVMAQIGDEPATFDHEYRIIRGDGEVRWIWGHGYPVGEYFVGIAQDITERRLVETEKRALAERMELVLRATHEGLWDWDVRTNTAWWSDRIYACFGLDHSVTPSYEGWAAAIHPDDRPSVLRSFDAAVTAGHDTWSADFRIMRGDEIREVQSRAYMTLDRGGKPLRVTGSMVDVTDRRELEAQLRQAQKMEAIGQLAGGVAHDFNNLLQAMMLELQQLQQLQPLPERAQTLARSVYGSAKRAASLTRQLLLFSRREVMQRRGIDLDAAITELGRMLHRVLGDDVALELDLRAAPLQIHADRNMLDQVILNLAVNARDAMPRGGTLHIATAPASGGPRPGPFGRITVRDTGIGIPRDVLPRIFEPFFTTKEAGHGTGLGLASAFGIVEQHGGWIEVESEIGVGSTFHVHLPVATVDIAAFAPTPPPTAAARGHETILVVEDNDHVRRVVCEVLADAGYRVLEAARGDAALQTWTRESGRIDIVLTDVVMPGGMDGRELAAQLESLRPGVKIVFATGHGRDFAVRPNQLLLSKPISAQNLLDAVRTCLDT